MQKKIIIISIFLLLVLIISISASEVMNDEYSVKVINFENEILSKEGYGYCEEKIIVISGYVSEYSYRQRLLHETVHHVCYKLFGDCDVAHARCFTKDYNEGKGLL